MGMETRRRTQRVALPEPIAARAGGGRAYVVDASVRGVRLWHSAELPEGKPCAVSFDWQGKQIEFIAELRWTKAQPGEIVYQSGFEIQKIDPGSNAALRNMVEDCLNHAIPLYDRHELVHGVWRKTTTSDSQQPESGFTVSATQSVHQVSLLRAAYSAGGPRMRQMIRRLAELTITHPERFKG